MNAKPVNQDSMVTSTQKALPSIILLPLAGGRPCLDFINTIDWRLNPDKINDTLTTYSDLLAFCLRVSLISTDVYATLFERALNSPLSAERVLGEARAFRDALTIIIDDITGTPDRPILNSPRPEALAFFEAARRKAHITESLIWKERQMRLIHRPEEEGFDLPWLILVRDAEELLCSSAATNIRICAAEGCGWAFLDTSKNKTRRWCSMKLCGNREKARRFKDR